MKITGFETTLLRIPYKVPIQWGARAGDGDDYLFLRVQTDEGIDGWAESMQAPPWSPITSRVLAQMLHEVYEPLVKDQDPLRPAQVWARLDSIREWNPAKSMIEVALCEIQAKNAGLPCWKFLGGWTNRVPVSWLINLGSPEVMLQDAHEAVKAHGFRSLKVKIGRNPPADVEAVRQLRATLGPDLKLFVDANGQYTQDEALWVADRIAEYDVSLFEDPCRMYLNERTRQMMARSPVPVMADRVVSTVEEAEQYMALGAAALNLKVPQMGYRETARVVEAAEARGVGCMVGVASETAIRALVSLHMRGALQHLDEYPAENSFFLKLPIDVLEEPVRIVDGMIELSEAPGFGVSLNMEAIEPYRLNL